MRCAWDNTADPDSTVAAGTERSGTRCRRNIADGQFVVTQPGGRQTRDSSGNEVVAASTVAPNSTPDMPNRPNTSSPLRSISNPATSVTRAARAKTSVARRVLTPLVVARLSIGCGRVPARLVLALGSFTGFVPWQTAPSPTQQHDDGLAPRFGRS